MLLRHVVVEVVCDGAAEDVCQYVDGSWNVVYFYRRRGDDFRDVGEGVVEDCAVGCWVAMRLA